MLKKIVNFLRLKILGPEKFARFLGVKIGNDCDIQDVSFGSEPYLIEIGNHVQITSGTKFFTHGGSWVLRPKNSEFDFFGKIRVGNNVYIGNNSMILPGVTIGDDVIIAAGSIVTKSISSSTIVGGNPAKRIGKIEEFEKKMTEFNVNSKGMKSYQKKIFLLSLDEEKFIKK